MKMNLIRRDFSVLLRQFVDCLTLQHFFSFMQNFLSSENWENLKSKNKTLIFKTGDHPSIMERFSQIHFENLKIHVHNVKDPRHQKISFKLLQRRITYECPPNKQSSCLLKVLRCGINFCSGSQIWILIMSYLW